MRSGLVIRVPAGAFREAPDDGIVFVPANEARAVAIPAVKKRLATVDGLEVGIAVIDGRVVGYLDVADGSHEEQACVVASLEGKGELALTGVRVLAAGRFPEAQGSDGVAFESRDIPAASIAALAARVEERFAHSRRDWAGGTP